MAGSSTVAKVYHSVVEDVITNVRESFLDEGVDEQVLQELKHLWESKLTQSKAIDQGPEPDPLVAVYAQQQRAAAAGRVQPTVAGIAAAQTISSQAAAQLKQQQQSQQQKVQVTQGMQIIQGTQLQNAANQQIQGGQVVINSASLGLSNAAQAAAVALPTTLYQQQLQLQPGTIIQGSYTNSAAYSKHENFPSSSSYTSPNSYANAQSYTCSNSYNRQVGYANSNRTSGTVCYANAHNYTNPAAYDGQHGHHNYHSFLRQDGTQYIVQASTGGLIQGAAGQQVAGLQLQATQQSQQQQQQQIITQQAAGQPGAGVIQLDGANDSSSEGYDDKDDDDDDDENDENDENNDDLSGKEEENPLNSDDDISDEDPSELFDTENIIVCQYDKINRSKNKWKFYLKDGVMNLNGKDYVFQKATGDAEW